MRDFFARTTVGISALLLGGAATATSVSIVNAGFEDPPTGSYTVGAPTGWTLGGSGGGVWNINVSPLGFWTASAPEGRQVGWLSPAPSPGSTASFTQALSDVLVGNSLYTLAGSVGHPIGYGTTPNPATVYTVELLAGSNVLATTSGTGPEGTFTTFSFNFDSTGSAFVGSLLAIRLTSSQAQTAFDAITLDYSALSQVPLPTGAAIGMAGLACLAGVRRRS